MTSGRRGVVYFLVPDGIDDDERISGGNVYDRHLREDLRALGWDVRMLIASTDRPGEAAKTLAGLRDDSLVLIDGLMALAISPALDQEADRLRIVVLAHMVAASLACPRTGETDRNERQALAAARRVIATSHWTRSELIARDLVPADRIVVAHPGTDSARLSCSGSAPGTRLLCVGAVAPHKGYDVLLEALAGIAGVFEWTCSIVGSLTVAPRHVGNLVERIEKAGLQHRVSFAGVLTGARLEDAYNSADLLIAPSRVESYGMAVTEALARGIPVIATRVGGLPEAIGDNPAGILVPPDDPWALGVVVNRWAGDAEWRAAIRSEARSARTLTRNWRDTAEVVSSALSDVAVFEPSLVVAGTRDVAGRDAE